MSVVGDVAWGTHFCQFYETKQDLLDTLVPYFKAGLESKEFCLWVVSNAGLITVEEAKGALEQAVPDFDRHLSDKNIEILNEPDWYLEENVFNLERVLSAWDTKLKRALALGYDGMRVAGDTFWLGENDWKDFCAYEKHINNSITDRPMTLLCTYPLAKSGAAEVLDVVESHQFAIVRRQGEWKVIESLELMQAKAEIKRLNEETQRVKERTPRQPLILSYGMAVLSVSAALIITLWLRMELGQESTPIVGLLLCAIMFSAWFGGVGPGLLATALSLLAFVYYFATPFYSLAMDIKEIPRLLILALSALFVGSLSTAQRSKAESLRRARDVLDETVQEVKRTNVALRAEITERKQAEEQLRESEELFRQFAENLQDVIWMVDSKVERPLYINPSYERVWGLPRESLNQNRLAFMEPVHPDDRDVVAGMLKEQREAKPATAEYRIIQPDGAIRWIRDRSFPVRNSEGEVYRIAGVAEDITAKKEAAQRLAGRVRISMLGEDVGRALTQSASLSEALNRCAEALVRHLDAAFARIWTIDETGQILELQASAGIYTNLNGTYSRVPVGHLKIGRIAHVRQPHLTNDLQNDSEVDNPEWVKQEGLVAFAGYPLIVEKQLLGVVGLFAHQPFSDLVLEALTSNTASIALGIKRAQAEQALRRSEALLRGTFERSAVGIALTDLNGRFVKTNNAYQKLLGYSETELEATTFQALIHPDELGRIQELLKELLGGRREQYQLEKRCITKNGDVIWVRSSISLIRDQQEKPQYIIAIVEDITERKQAEEKLKLSESQLAEAQRLAHIGSWSLDLSSKKVTWSDELYRIFGVQPSEFDHRYEAVVGSAHPEDRDRIRSVIEDSIKTHEPFSIYYRITLPTGELRIVHAHGAVVPDEHGNASRMHGAAQDVTERMQAEERLRETTGQLRALSARIHSAKEEEGTRIAREIHDELGAALTSLRWDLESFDKIISESGDQSQLKVLRERIESMLRLTETTIGSVRRISSELRPSVLDDLGLVEAIEWQAQQFQSRTGIICRWDCSLENFDLSQEQSTAIFRIFQEALTNILRHAQATSVGIMMKAEAGEFVLAIIDNGRGITENEKSGSQSLGLLGMQERAHLIGGKISFTGVEGEGTVITIRVPIPG
jgi:PAS domain S-box-containing protein